MRALMLQLVRSLVIDMAVPLIKKIPGLLRKKKG